MQSKTFGPMDTWSRQAYVSCIVQEGKKAVTCDFVVWWQWGPAPGPGRHQQQWRWLAQQQRHSHCLQAMG